MEFLLYISNFIIPFLIFYVVGFGLIMKKNVYDDFVRGAKDGFTTVIGIMPTLIGLMVGVGILRESGFLELLGKTLGKAVAFTGFPPALVPMVIVRLFSSSAATGLTLDIFKEYGPDSPIGYLASIIMSCTETVFYTMSVYFIAAKVTKTRYTLPGALIASLAGIIASVIVTGFA